MRLSRSVFLIGFSGSGKTTVGRLLARECRAEFVDTDELIAQRCRMSVTEIFRRKGERFFRDREVGVIAELIEHGGGPLVVALGGGALVSPRNQVRVAEAGTVVYLSCAMRQLYARLKRLTDRPLLAVAPNPGQTIRQARLEAIGRLLDARKPGYLTAGIRISTTSLTVEQTVSKLLRKLEILGGSN